MIMQTTQPTSNHAAVITTKRTSGIETREQEEASHDETVPANHQEDHRDLEDDAECLSCDRRMMRTTLHVREPHEDHANDEDARPEANVKCSDFAMMTMTNHDSRRQRSPDDEDHAARQRVTRCLANDEVARPEGRSTAT